MLKVKDNENILKASRIKRHTVFKAATVRLMTDFLIARGQWNDIFKVLKKNAYRTLTDKWKFSLKENFSERKKMISDGSTDTQNERESTSKGKSEGRQKLIMDYGT